MAYITEMKIAVDMTAYSMSCVALNAINMSNQHGDETENLTIEEGLEVLGNLDRVTSEETLVQDDEGEENGLSFNDSFSWGTDWSKEAIEFGHL
jgi:hypothetical protein